MRADMWEPVDGIDGPCDHIGFFYKPNHTATVSMTFAGSAGRPARILILRFHVVIVLTGEDECPGDFVPAPAIPTLPKLRRGEHPSYTFPLLKMVDSKPLNQYQLMYPQPLAHFFLISMDNLVQVISSADVDATWSAENPSGSHE